MKLFPKIKGLRSIAASVLFRLPVVRELCLWTGCIDAGKPTCLKNLKAGYSLTVIPGGIAEQMLTNYGKEEVYLKKRMGFCKLALETNTKLVPTYVFGTNDLFYTSRFLFDLRWWIAMKFWMAIPVAWAYGTHHQKIHDLR